VFCVSSHEKWQTEKLRQTHNRRETYRRPGKFLMPDLHRRGLWISHLKIAKGASGRT